jgi:anti-sigma factor RsiW
MNENHIIDILDGTPLGKLDESQLRVVRGHVEDCPSCARAYDAALLVSNVVHARTAATIEPSPFFATRVLAAVREQQANSVPVILRLWRSASVLVSSLAVTTAALAVMSIVVPGPGTSETATLGQYSAEAVILNDEEDPLSYEQVLSTIYADEEEAR